MLSLILMSALAAVPLQCPPGSTAHSSSSSTSEWIICEKPSPYGGEGIREGPMLFVSNGHVASRMNYRDGEQDGEQISYGLTGEVVEIARYRAGKKHGLTERWNAAHVKTLEDEYANDQRDGHYRYWREDGTLIVESVWRNGEPQRFTSYYPNGQKRAEALSPLPNTKITEWDESGKVTRTIVLVDGIERGAKHEDATDTGHLSCPKETFPKVKPLGVGYTEDRCGGFPEPSADGKRIETYAWVPRSKRAALSELGCTFSVMRTAESADQQAWQIYFGSHAEVGE